MFKRKPGMFPNGKNSFIGKGFTFEGRIQSETDIFVEGCIIGNVQCQGNVIIAEQGAVVADISSNNVIVSGAVTGNVNTIDTLVITETGKMIGDISIDKMVIVKGGILQGNCRMKNKSLASLEAEKRYEADEPASGPADEPLSLDNDSSQQRNDMKPFVASQA